MNKKPLKDTNKARRQFTDQFKKDAVQMLLDGHTASSIVDRLGLESEKGYGLVLLLALNFPREWMKTFACGWHDRRRRRLEYIASAPAGALDAIGFAIPTAHAVG